MHEIVKVVVDRLRPGGYSVLFLAPGLYCEVEKKPTYLKFLYLPKLLADSDDIYGVYQAISQVFLGGKIFLEYSSFVEISAQN